MSTFVPICPDISDRNTTYFGNAYTNFSCGIDTVIIKNLFTLDRLQTF